jgi:aconitase B
MNEKVVFHKQEEDDEDNNGYEAVEKYFGNASTVPLVVDAGLANLQGAHVSTTADKAIK